MALYCSLELGFYKNIHGKPNPSNKGIPTFVSNDFVDTESYRYFILQNDSIR